MGLSTESIYRPDPQFHRLGPDFSDPVMAATFPQGVERFRNDRAAKSVGLHSLSSEQWRLHFWAFEPLPDNLPSPRAMRYHGHQFQIYNRDLGDGRGFLFAQLRDGQGRLLDLATKGSGQTPYSRAGDGRLTLKGGVREVLATAMLEARGVNSSKSFSLFETGEALQRSDEPSPTRGAVLVRLSHSHIRFGTFQRHFAESRADNLQKLVDHAAEHYFPEIMQSEGPDRALRFYGRVIDASAQLVAQWMAAGFVHGVLNTDNMNITGESFDYGPYRFLPRSDPNFTAAYFDQNGLYRFGRQPEVMQWNLARLGECLTPLCEGEALNAALAGFSSAYSAAIHKAMFARLGLSPGGDEIADRAWLGELFGWMTRSGISWEGFFFDWYGGLARADAAFRGPRGSAYEDPDFGPIRQRLTAYAPASSQIASHPYFAHDEPEDLLYPEIEGIWQAIARDDDWQPFYAKLARIEGARLAHAPNPMLQMG